MLRVRTVRLFGRMCFLVVALLWVPLTAHCRIASVPGLEFLRCGDHEHSEDQDHKSCEDRGCCAQENGNYQCSRWEDLSPNLPPDLVNTLGCGVLVRGLAREETEGVLIAAPPPTPPSANSWTFELRLALPVRAPSADS
ncbi:MAG: hypothetical protein IT581_22425 [Verrucomicrobiales bacterium]|nr:hypothetical protein [Verrucomicrobiales bacterium]